MTTAMKPFPALVCQRLRNLIAKYDQLESAHGDAKKARLHAEKEIEDGDDDGSPARKECLEEYGRRVHQVDSLAADMKWVEKEIETTLRKADESGLFDSADVEVPKHVHKPAPSEEPAKPAADAAPAARDGELSLAFPGRFVFVAHQEGVEGGTFDVLDRVRLDVKIKELCRTDDLTFDHVSGLVYQGGVHLLTVMNAAADSAKRGRKKKSAAT